MSPGGSELVSMQTFDIARKLQNRLPKELRILIYQHYWDFGRSDEFRTAEIFYFHGVSKSLPAYILPSFVGIDIARETIIEFFRCMILSEPGETGMQVLLRDIDHQLWRDAFNVGITVDLRFEICASSRPTAFDCTTLVIIGASKTTS